MSKTSSTAKTQTITCTHIPDIQKIADKTFPRPWKDKDFAYFLTHETGWCRGVFEDGRLVAYLLSLVVQGEMDLVSIATAPDVQRKGHAKRLIEEAKTANGVGRILLEVNVHNESAIKFYEKLGFKSYGKRLQYYEYRDDALLMHWCKR